MSEEGKAGAAASAAGAFRAVSEQLDHRTLRVQFFHTETQSCLTWGEVIDLWASDTLFRRYYSEVLAESPYEHFYFECPPVDKERLNVSYEHVLISAREFRQADPSEFSEHFEGKARGVVSFWNLGGDARLDIACRERNDVVLAYECNNLEAHVVWIER